MGFQAQVNQQPAVGIRGDFADAGLRTSLLFGGAGLVSAPSPRSPIVGNFAWGDLASGRVYGRHYGESSVRIGYLHREQQGIIVPFLSDSQLTLESGLILTLMTNGTFWAWFGTTALVGQSVFANYLDGSMYAATTGTSTQTASVTASFASTGVMTVTAVANGTLRVGALLTGGNIPAGTQIAILSLGTGAGGTGTYNTTATSVITSAAAVLATESVQTNFKVMSPADADASVTGSIAITGVLTVSAVASGVLAQGQELIGTGIPRATRILGQITGTAGSTGTYRTNLQVGPVVASTAIIASTGMLGKISSWS